MQSNLLFLISLVYRCFAYERFPNYIEHGATLQPAGTFTEAECQAWCNARTDCLTGVWRNDNRCFGQTHQNTGGRSGYEGQLAAQYTPGHVMVLPDSIGCAILGIETYSLTDHGTWKAVLYAQSTPSIPAVRGQANDEISRTLPITQYDKTFTPAENDIASSVGIWRTNCNQAVFPAELTALTVDQTIEYDNYATIRRDTDFQVTCPVGSSEFPLLYLTTCIYDFAVPASAAWTPVPTCTLDCSRNFSESVTGGTVTYSVGSGSGTVPHGSSVSLECDSSATAGPRYRQVDLSTSILFCDEGAWVNGAGVAASLSACEKCPWEAISDAPMSRKMSFSSSGVVLTNYAVEYLDSLEACGDACNAHTFPDGAPCKAVSYSATPGTTSGRSRTGPVKVLQCTLQGPLTEPLVPSELDDALVYEQRCGSASSLCTAQLGFESGSEAAAGLSVAGDAVTQAYGYRGFGADDMGWQSAADQSIIKSLHCVDNEVVTTPTGLGWTKVAEGVYPNGVVLLANITSGSGLVSECKSRCNHLAMCNIAAFDPDGAKGNCALAASFVASEWASGATTYGMDHMVSYVVYERSANALV